MTRQERSLPKVKGAILARKDFFGCAGWSYKEWVGPLYDTEKNMLRQYAKIFDTAEINSSFYSFPQPGTVLGMARYTNRGFMFTAKLNQRFTHDLRLRVDDRVMVELEDFCSLFDPLLNQERLGSFLVQLPPFLKADFPLLEAFLAALPKRYDYVVEFRHKSWMDHKTWDTLEKYSAAYCIVDEPLLPPEIHVTSDLAYVRWHGHAKNPWYNYRYTEQQLREWVPKIEELRASTKRTYGIFNNHFHGYAPENCIQIMKMLGMAEPKHEEALERIQAHIEKRIRPLPKGALSLDQYVRPEVVPVEELIVPFTSSTRLERAKEIAGDEISIEQCDDQFVRANVRRYSVVVDLERKMIRHDCADWEKTKDSKQLCKHLAALLLRIPPTLCRTILSDLDEHREQWRFLEV